MLLPDRGDNFIRAVGIRCVGQDVLRGIEVIGVLMAAENIDRIARDAQPRTRDQPFVDRVAHRAVGGAGTLRAHVAFGGKSRHQVIFGRKHRQDGPLRHGFFDRLQILGARMQKEVHMGIDETRQQRAVAQVDELRACWMRNRGSDGGNAFPFDQNLARRNHAAGIDFEQARGVQNDRMAGARLLGGLRVRRQCECRASASVATQCIPSALRLLRQTYFDRTLQNLRMKLMAREGPQR